MSSMPLIEPATPLRDPTNRITSDTTGQAPQTSQQPAPVTRKACPRQALFIKKLYGVLADKDCKRWIYWSDDGKRIIVPDSHEFTLHVLHRLCQTTDFASFVRQLNHYGFRKGNHSRRSKHAPESRRWEFENEGFQRGQTVDASSIRRKPRQIVPEDDHLPPISARSVSSPGPPPPPPPSPLAVPATASLPPEETTGGANAPQQPVRSSQDDLDKRLARLETLIAYMTYRQHVTDTALATLSVTVSSHLGLPADLIGIPAVLNTFNTSSSRMPSGSNGSALGPNSGGSRFLNKGASGAQSDSQPLAVPFDRAILPPWGSSPPAPMGQYLSRVQANVDELEVPQHTQFRTYPPPPYAPPSFGLPLSSTVTGRLPAHGHLGGSSEPLLTQPDARGLPLNLGGLWPLEDDVFPFKLA